MIVYSNFNLRANIEEDYAKRMAKLSRTTFSSLETGCLKESVQVMKAEVDNMAKSHLQISQLLQDDVENAFTRYAASLKDKKKMIVSGIEKVHKDKLSKHQALVKAQDKYHYLCKKVNYYVSQQNMLFGKELEKNNAKLNKTQNAITASSSDYQSAVAAVRDSYARWTNEWRSTCDKLQDIEEERRHFLKSVMWTFTLLISRSCFNDDQACERIRKNLEQCSVSQDVLEFIDAKSTGTGIPQPPKFYDYYKGEVPDDSVELVQANFQRAQTKIENDNMPLNRPYVLSATARNESSFENTLPNTPSAIQSLTTVSSNSSQNGRSSPKKSFLSKFKLTSRPSTPNVGNTAPDALSSPRNDSPLTSAADEQMKHLSLQEEPKQNPTPAAPGAFPNSNTLPPRYNELGSLPSPNSVSFTEDSRPNVNTPSRRQQIQEEFGSVLQMENRAVSPVYDSRKNGSRSSFTLRKSRSPKRPSSSLSQNASRLPRSLTPGNLEPNYDFGVRVDPASGTAPTDDEPYTDRDSSFVDDTINTKATGNTSNRLSLPAYPTDGGDTSIDNPTSTDGQRILGYGMSNLSIAITITNLNLVSALYDYDAAIPEEISFRKGDTIAVLKLYEDGWWEGFVVGEDDHNRGQFPSNFVREIEV